MDSNLDSIEYNAAIKKASQWTHRLIDTTDRSKGGTVISIRIGSRYFLATAAHVISSKHKFEIVLRNHDIEPIYEFIACHVNAEADVGLLEIDKKGSDLIDSWVVLSDIYHGYNPDKCIPVDVIGYPGEYITPVDKTQITENDFIQYNHCMSLCYASNTIPSEKWPKEGLCQKSQEENDIFVDYDPGGEMYISPPNETEPSRSKMLKCPKLFGMSGGGIWVLESKTGEIWQPSTKLLGIQSSVHESKGWMRGTKINSWLKLVADSYPDLKNIVV